jgi:hypothetical protein
VAPNLPTTRSKSAPVAVLGLDNYFWESFTKSAQRTEQQKAEKAAIKLGMGRGSSNPIKAKTQPAKNDTPPSATKNS